MHVQEHEGRHGVWRDGGVTTCHLSMSKVLLPSWPSPGRALCPPLLPLRVLVALAVGGTFSSPVKGITTPGVVWYVERGGGDKEREGGRWSGRWRRERMFVGRSGKFRVSGGT